MCNRLVQKFKGALKQMLKRMCSERLKDWDKYINPLCKGIVEKFNGTLKQMLKRMCSERPKYFNKCINPILFAYREIPQENMSFAPIDLLYGRTACGPMVILKDFWTKGIPAENVKTTYQYVLNLKARLEEICMIAFQNLKKASKHQCKYYNRKNKKPSNERRRQLTVLLPTKSNKLLMQWKGPYSIIQQIGQMDYKIDMGVKMKQLLQILRNTLNENLKTVVFCHSYTLVIQMQMKSRIKFWCHPFLR